MCSLPVVFKKVIMKIFHTLPTNDSFYNRYIRLIPTLYRVGFIAQLISALTEFGIIWSLIFSAANDFFPSRAWMIAGIGATIGTALLEVGLRKFTPFSVRAIIFRRFKGIDLAMSVIIMVGTLGLLLVSGLLSFKGSKGMVATVAPQPKERVDTEAREVFELTTEELRNDYVTAKNDVKERFTSQISAIQQQYASLIGIEKTKDKRYRAMEASSGQSYRTIRARISSRIAELEAERDTKVAELRAEETGKLAAVIARRDARFLKAEVQLDKKQNAVTTFNELEKQRVNGIVRNYGNGLAWFTVFCLLVFVVSVTLNELHHKGSGIEERALPTQYNFSQSLVGSFLNALGNRFQQRARTIIQRIEETTPAPPPPIAPHGLFDYSGLKQPRHQLSFENECHWETNIEYPTHSTRFTSMDSVVNPVQTNEEVEKLAISYLRAQLELLKAGLKQQAEEMSLKADDVIRSYLGEKATQEDVVNLRKQIISFLKGEGENPFQHHHRQPIGFSKSENDSRHYNGPIIIAREKERVIDSSLKNCVHCGKVYKPKTWNQRYCSKECKTAFHTAKHDGQVFDPGRYHRAKN